MARSKPELTNEDVADVLDRMADLLKAQDANPFRVRAYRDAASTVRAADRSIADLVRRHGEDGLEDLPGIGKSLASAIEELVTTGRLGMLERLQGEVSPEGLFKIVPGIGEDLAKRIHAELGVETLEDLEQAANDGRLAKVPGFGERRVRAVRETLDAMLRRSTRRRARLARERDHKPGKDRPSVAAILAVDAEYRARADAGRLRKIAPKRFNPEGKAWLPIFHAERDGFSFTALYSNTARAHELGKTGDWVVIYFERDGREGQCTVVTEHQGKLAGERVVRGREAECLDHYAKQPK
jgi:DNA polymerase (family 10)